jgi:hypothetical protein
MKRVIFPVLLICVVMAMFSGCKGSGALMPNVSGGSFEVLLVINEDIYNSPAGEEMFNIIHSPVPRLPQPEPQFKMSRIRYDLFDNLLRTTRNIIFVVVDPEMYTRCTVSFIKDRWARTQAIVNITAPDTTSLKAGLVEQREKIIDFIVKAERDRQIDYLTANINQEALNRVYKKFGCKVALPTSLNKYKEENDFIWISNGSSSVRQDAVIYSLPYMSENQLTKESLLSIRDSVLGKYITGGMEGSHMGTEYRYLPPEMKIINQGGSWCGEIRGLWKMVDGDAMGGPFISHARVDELNNRIVIMEGFVFAPQYDKRNPLRQMDAMVYSLKLPQEINEVTVVVKRPKQK